MNQYKIGKILGDGTFGSVAIATNKQNNSVYAIKKMKKKFYKWKDCINLNEVKVLLQLQHPNIVKLIEIIKEKNQLYFVFEYMQQNVYQFLKERQKLYDYEIRNIIFQTLQGLHYIHQQGYFHRDLKPENLLELNGIIKIADFGLIKLIGEKQPYTEYVSTRWYRAPEIVLRSTVYGSQIDIFAIGAIMAELYKCQPIFPGTNEIDQLNKICQILGTPIKSEWNDGYKLSQQIGYSFPNYQPQNLQQILPNASKMLKFNPFHRITVNEALNHPYFQCFLPILEEINIDFQQNLQHNYKLAEQHEEQKQNHNSSYYIQKARYKPDVKSNLVNIQLI